MSLDKRLSKHARKGRLPLIILFAALAAIFGLAAFASYNDAHAKLHGLMEYNGSQIRTGTWYEANLHYIVGGYAEDKKGLYYIAPLEQDGTYLGIYVPKSMQSTADKIMDETMDYLNGGSEPTTYLKGRGKLTNMAPKEKEYFIDWFEVSGVSSLEVGSMAVYYKLDMVEGKSAGTDAIIFGLVAAASLAIAAIILIRFIGKKYRKKVDQTIQERGLNPDFIEEDLNGGLKTRVADFGKHYAILYNSPQQLVDYQDLVWVYKQKNTTTHKLYGVIPVGKTVAHAVVLTTRDKKQMSTTVKKEAEADEVLQYLIAQVPYALYGYTEELAGVYKQNFETMIAAVDQRKASNV
ncbi:MAG: hypothetical protein K6A77_01475 [Clostridiales bacterium]|nr:hypothetical protein [Clostridiales bacterium]